MQKLRSVAMALVLLSWLSSAPTWAATKPAAAPLNERVLVVYNAGSAESKAVAEHYLKARQIPEAHLLAIQPSSITGMPGYPGEYLYSKAIKEVLNPLKEALTRCGEQKILYIVFTYGTPYGVKNDVWKYPEPNSRGFVFKGYSLDSYLADPFEDLKGTPTFSPRMMAYCNPYSPGCSTFGGAIPFSTGGGIDGPVNAVAGDKTKVQVPPVVYVPFESLAAFRARTGKRIYSVFRLDGPTPKIAMEQVDKALQAEKAGGLDKMGGTFYFDRKRPDNSLVAKTPGGQWRYDEWGDWMIFRAKQHALKAGLPCAQESTWRRIGEPESDLPKTPKAVFYSGTYGWYNTVAVGDKPQPDPWEWLPGAMGFEFKSESMFGGPRGDNNPPKGKDKAVGWSVGAIAAGLTATRGTIQEPGTAGPAHTDALLRNLLEGANIGDAFFRDEFFIGAMWLHVGDPLYTPFPGGRAPFAR